MTGTASRSLYSCTTRLCSMTPACPLRSAGQRGWRPRTRVSRPRSVRRWSSSAHRAGDWFTRAMRSVAASSGDCTRPWSGDSPSLHARWSTHEVGNTDSARLRNAKDQLARTLDELRDLAAGLHPGVIERSGLPGALASLVARSPVQVELRVTEERVAEELSTAALLRLLGGAGEHHQVRQRLARGDLGHPAGRAAARRGHRRRGGRSGDRRRHGTVRSRRPRGDTRRNARARQSPGGRDVVCPLSCRSACRRPEYVRGSPARADRPAAMAPRPTRSRRLDPSAPAARVAASRRARE